MGTTPTETVTEQDLRFLRRAIELAMEARRDGRQPFGSLIVDPGSDPEGDPGSDAEDDAGDGQLGKIVAEARNNAVRPAGDPTQHAETLACSDAAKRLTEAELARCTLYTSTEPCAMCAGAIYWSGVGRVVFGLSERGLLALTGDHPENSTLDLPCREVFARGHRKIEVVGPLLEAEAAKAHEGFWDR